MEKIVNTPTEYYMIMYGWNSTGGGRAPFLIPTSKINRKDIDDFFGGGSDEMGNFAIEDLVEFHITPIPSEFGKTQIIKGMFFGIEQSNGGIEISEDGKKTAHAANFNFY